MVAVWPFHLFAERRVICEMLAAVLPPERRVEETHMGQAEVTARVGQPPGGNVGLETPCEDSGCLYIVGKLIFRRFESSKNQMHLRYSWHSFFFAESYAILTQSSQGVAGGLLQWSTSRALRR